MSPSSGASVVGSAASFASILSKLALRSKPQTFSVCSPLTSGLTRPRYGVVSSAIAHSPLCDFLPHTLVIDENVHGTLPHSGMINVSHCFFPHAIMINPNKMGVRHYGNIRCLGRR